MNNCPSCKEQLSSFYIEAPAIIETVQLVRAECTPDDFDEKNMWTSSSYRNHSLISFRLDERIEMRDNCTDHSHLEYNDPDAIFFCGNCNIQIPKELCLDQTTENS